MLSEALCSVVAMDEEDRGAMGTSGERFARRTFDVRRHADALEDIYCGHTSTTLLDSQIDFREFLHGS
jgi:hypothetical protein